LEYDIASSRALLAIFRIEFSGGCTAMSATICQNCKQSAGRKCLGKRAMGVVPLICGIVLLLNCSRRRDPQAVFDHAMQTLRSGDAAAAALEADKGYSNFHKASPEWAWKFIILRARTRYRLGNNDEALKLLASEPTPLPPGELAVQKLRWEGLAYASLHRFTDADGAFQEAGRICAITDYPVCADVVSAQGVVEMHRGHYAQAQPFFERVLASARASHNSVWEANTLLDLSWSADEQTHFDEALDWASAARRISVDLGSADLAEAALGNMGWAYYKLGDPEKALEMFVEAARQAAKLGDVPDQAKWLTNAGYIHMDHRDFAAAEQFFQQSLELTRKIKTWEAIDDSLVALAFLSEQTGKLDDAKRYADEAFARAREDKNGREQVYPQLVLGRVAALRHDTTTAESAFREVAQSPDCPVFLKWEAERSLARLYEDENKSDFAKNEYQTALTTFETARSDLQHEDSRLPFLSNAAHIYDDYIHLLVAQSKTAEALQVADFSRARTLSEGLGLLSKGSSFTPEALNAQQIARHAGGTVLFYWLGEAQSYLWAITPQKISLFQLPPSAEIKTRVERYRKAIIDQRESSPTANDDGATLYRILVEPAKDLLPTNGKVFIIPDGSLNSLNFETLLVPDTPDAHAKASSSGENKEPANHYWIEDVTLSSASSLRMLKAFHAAHDKGSGNLLLFGDAISPSEDFPALPKASVEMASIKKHFASAQQEVFAREQATPPAYLASKPERFSYIHFVAHGTASRLSPLDSAIVLSKPNTSKPNTSKPNTSKPDTSKPIPKADAQSKRLGNPDLNTEEDSYKLYARVIEPHPIRAELVTVSTCRSAGERAYSGEGLVGLSWAFMRAGAHNVIGALWDVSDVSTPQLMDELYGELKKGKAPDVALRNAKLTLLHSKASFHKPFYWAPFQLYTGS
jgi:CHAT domain-containing protein